MKSYYPLLLLGCILFSSPTFSCEGNDVEPFKKPVKPSPKLSEFATTLLSMESSVVEDYLLQLSRKSESELFDNIAILEIELKEIEKKNKINTNVPLERLKQIYKIAEKVVNSLGQ